MTRRSLVLPIFTGEAHSTAVRFFAPPNARPAFAWVALQDARLAAHLPEVRNPSFRSDLRRDAADDVQRIATADSLETIVAFWIGRALFDAGVLVGTVDQATRRAFVRQAAIATAMLTDPRDGMLERYLIQARARQDASMARFMP